MLFLKAKLSIFTWGLISWINYLKACLCKIRCRVVCEMPNSKERRGMDKPGFSSRLWATEVIFAGVLAWRARVQFFTSLIWPNSSNVCTNFTIAGQEGASRRSRKLLTLQTVSTKFSHFFSEFEYFQCVVEACIVPFLLMA